MYKLFLLLVIELLSCFIIIAQEQDIVERFLPNTIVTDVCGDTENIWIATNGKGIFKIAKESKRLINYSTNNGNLQHDFFYCITSNDRFVWAGSTDGLFIFDKRKNNWSKRKFGKGGQLSNWIRSLAYDKFNNALWIGRFKYLTKMDIKKRRFYDFDLTVGQDEKSNTIKCIEVDGDSVVWFGTEAGLHKYDKSKEMDNKNSTKFYSNRKNYFNGDGDAVSISAILTEQNFLWIGTDEFITPAKPNFNIGGLYKFDRRNEWVRYDNTDGFPGNGIYDLELTGNFIWVSVYQFSKSTNEEYGRGLLLINRLNGKVTLLSEERLPNTIFALYFDGEKMWLGSDEGLYSINFINNLSIWNSGE